MLNIPKEDYRLRTEVTYAFSKLNITEDMLVFRDSLDLMELNEAGKLALTLVDHNVLRGEEYVMESAVTEVIDHHQRERPEDTR